MKRILFVDDEPDILAGIRRSLREQNLSWDIRYVGSGKEALELLDRERFDAIITDVCMPEMNGKELLSIASNRYPDLIQIILSGAELPSDYLYQGIRQHYLQKPCPTNSLVKTIERGLLIKELFQLKFLSQVRDIFKDYTTFPELQIQIHPEKVSADETVKATAEVVCSELGITFRVPLNKNEAVPEYV